METSTLAAWNQDIIPSGLEKVMPPAEKDADRSLNGANYKTIAVPAPSMEPKPRSVTIVGLGYVGLSTAVSLASRGFRVLGVDVDERRVENLRHGVSPIHEEGLTPLLRRAIKKKYLRFESNYNHVADSATIFITVGTPSRDDGGIDTTYVESASKELGHRLKDKGYRLVVVKSTVTPGTTESLVLSSLEKGSGKRAGRGFGLVSNPEFLHEGSAIDETFNPDALVVGGHDKRSSDALLRLYRLFYGKLPQTVITTPSNAEMMKYAINSGRAVQLSFVNTIANLCTRTPGCDYDEVRKGLSMVAKMDQRYLAAGMGFGGSCVPPYTRVVTGSGFKPISSIRVGDLVLSRDGYYRKVTRTYTREYDGMMYLFRSQGFSSTPLLVTPEHPILSSLRNTGEKPRFYTTTVAGRGAIQKLNNLYLIEPPRFNDPSSLAQGDFMVLPSFREESTSVPVLFMESARRRYSLRLCPDLMYLFGLWVAEGMVDTKRGEVLFSLNATETEFLGEIDKITRRYLGVRATIKKSSTKRNSLVVRVKSRAFALFVDRTFSHRAENKHIPWEWLTIERGLLVPLLRGIWYGDGSNRNTEPYRRFAYCTVSNELADFMEIAFLKLRMPYRRLLSNERTDKRGVHHRNAHYIIGIDNSIMNKLLPRLRIPLALEAHRTSWFEGPNFVFPIKNVRVVKYSGTVHNLEVEKSNSYVVAGATLHNCLPKDLRALASTLRSSGEGEDLVATTLRVNQGQVEEAIRLAETLCGSLEGKRVSVLGLAFKPGTDDIRESTAISLVRNLIKKGVEVSTYDPGAMENARRLLGSQVAFAKNIRDCIRNSECAFVATAWEEFKKLQPGDFKTLMVSPVVVDGRRIYDQARFKKAGVKIATIGTGMPIDKLVGQVTKEPRKRVVELERTESRSKQVKEERFEYKGVIGPSGTPT